MGDVPGDEGLELVAAVCPAGGDPRGELLHDVVDEVDGVGLRVTAVALTLGFSLFGVNSDLLGLPGS